MFLFTAIGNLQNPDMETEELIKLTKKKISFYLKLSKGDFELTFYIENTFFWALSETDFAYANEAIL